MVLDMFIAKQHPIKNILREEGTYAWSSIPEELTMVIVGPSTGEQMFRGWIIPMIQTMQVSMTGSVIFTI